MAITIIHIHRFEFPAGSVPWVTRADLRALEDYIMGVLEDKVAAIKQAIDDMKARVQADIDDLKAKVAAGAVTQEVLDDLDAIKTSLDEEDPIPPEPTP